MSIRATGIGLALLMVVPCVAGAATIRVPTNQPTIQAGIDAASEGDTVLVEAGTYTGTGNYDITIETNNVVVMSEIGAAATIIDTEGNGKGFSIVGSGINSTTIVKGLTIKNASESTNGGGVSISLASPVIEDCILQGNTGSNGGGIYIGGNTATEVAVVRNCTFDGNTAVYRGGGVTVDHRDGRIENCTFYSNTATGIGGGAIDIRYTGTGTEATGCTIVKNSIGASASMGGAGICVENASPTVTQNIVFMNTGGTGVHTESGNQPVYTNNLVFWNEGGDDLGGMYVTGLIHHDPLFCDYDNDNYSLCENSPCLPDADGNPGTELIGAHGEGCLECAQSAVEPESWGRVKAKSRKW